MPHLLRELDTAQTFWQKLGLTLFLLFFGVLLAPLFFLALRFNPEPAYYWFAQTVTDVVVGYYVVLLVYIWWRPPWLQRLYLAREARLVRKGNLLGLIFLCGFIGLAVISLADYYLNRQPG